ncbi:MAG: hypothetical protein ABFD96_03535 [Armatimonadia bacterium]
MPASASPPLSASRYAAIALSGAGLAAGVAQVVLLRQLLNLAAGNELTIGLMLAAWFFWGAMGALLVARRGERDEGQQSLLRVLKLSVTPLPAMMIGMVVIALAPPVLAKLPTSLGAQPGQVLGLLQMLVLSLLAVLPSGIVAGAQFAAGMRLYGSYRPGPHAAGNAYALDALGHLTGGVLAAVLLFGGATAREIAFCGGVLALWGAAGLWTQARRPTGQQLRPLQAALLVALVTTCYLPALVPMPSPLTWRGEKVLAEKETIHGSLAVTRFGTDGAYFYLNGVPGASSPPTPGIQHLIHFPLLQVSKLRTVLLIGGGATGGLREVLQYPGVSRVTYAELDPGLIDLARQYTVGADRQALSDPRVSIHPGDGRLLVKQMPHHMGLGPPYDAVILGLPDPSTAQINRFYTVDFLREVARVLKPEGVLGLQVPSSDTYLGDELLRLDAVLLRTVQAVFPQVALLPGDPMVIAATRSGRLTEDADVLRARMDRLRIEAPEFRAHAWDRLFPFEVSRARESFAEAPPLPLNTDGQPIAYFYDQAYWVAQYSRSSWAFFRLLERLDLRDALVALGALLVVLGVPGLFSARVRCGYVPLAIFGTGWIAMALEVTLLFAFQVYYGYVYAQLGIITGAFMIGLAVGGIGAGRRLERLGARGTEGLLIGLQGSVTVLALALPGLLALIGGESAGGGFLLPNLVFPALTAVVGVLVGAEFPVASRLLQGQGHPATAAAGVYAADLLGSCAGALVAGAALLPVLGLYGTCYAAAGVSMVVTVLLTSRLVRRCD